MWAGSDVLFAENVGLFAENVGLFAENVGLFAENVGLFAENVGPKYGPLAENVSRTEGIFVGLRDYVCGLLQILTRFSLLIHCRPCLEILCQLFLPSLENKMIERFEILIVHVFYKKLRVV